MNTKIKSFKDLDAWKKSYNLCSSIYRIDISNVNISNQIKRSSLSVCSNISEGFGRQSKNDKKHFYIMARGSLYEVQNQIILLYDLKIINKENFEKLGDLSSQSAKLIQSLIRSVTP